MAQQDAQAQANFQMAREAAALQQLLDKPDALTPDERVEAETMLRDYANGVAQRGTLSPQEIEVLQGPLLSRVVSANTAKELRELREKATAPGRFVSSMQAGMAEEVHNLGMVGIDIVSAGLGPVTDPNGRLQAGLDNTRNRIRAHRNAMNAELEAQMIASYGLPDSKTSAFAEFAGDMVGRLYPYVFAPAQLGTYTRTVLYNGMLGGIAGGATVEDANGLMERMDGLKMGALIGLFGSGVLNARQGFQRYAARKIENQLTTRYAQESMQLEREIQRLTGVEDFSFSLGQITANPFVVGLEIGAGPAVQREAQVRRLAILRDTLKLRANALRSSGRSEIEIVEDLQATAREVIGGMRKFANNNYAASLDNVIAHWGDEAALNGRHFLEELGVIMDDWANPLVGGSSTSVPKSLLEMHAVVRRHVNPFRVRKKELQSGRTQYEVIDLREFGRGAADIADDILIGRASAQRLFKSHSEATAWTRAMNEAEGGLNAEQTRDLLKGFRRMIGGESPVFEGATSGSIQNLGQALRRVFLEELEMGVKNKDAVNAVMSMRKVYETDMYMIDGVRRTMLTDMLGQIPQQGYGNLLKQFTTRKPAELRATREFLIENDPTLLYDLQRTELERVAASALNSNQKASMGEVDIYRFADALTGETGTPGSVAKGLWSPKEQAELSQVGRALQRLHETHMSLFPEASGSKIADISINLVSQTKEFVARLLARLFVSSSGVARVLNDPQTRRTIIELANSPIGSAKYQMAQLSLAMTAAEYVAYENALADEAARKQDVQDLQERHMIDPLRQ